MADLNELQLTEEVIRRCKQRYGSDAAWDQLRDITPVLFRAVTQEGQDRVKHAEPDPSTREAELGFGSP